jgi:glycosyltransferase involved in cell wall biosynthesis
MKIAIYNDTGWSLGQLYGGLSPHLQATCLEWSRSYPPGTFEAYDRVLTLAGDGSRSLVERYKVPRGKILVVGHAEQDVLRLLRYDGNDGIDQYAGYGVVSDTLACSSLTAGVRRVPTVLRQGVDCAAYAAPVPERLRVVGYAALLSRPNEFGVEIKRGELVRRACDVAGLEFRPAVPTNRREDAVPRDEMPAYYASVDAVVCSSLQEGGAMPPYEAAASGRLVYGTPVGDFPRLAYEGMGILIPLNDADLVEFLVHSLGEFLRDRRTFQQACRAVQHAARGRDLVAVAPDWVRFAGSSS